MAYDASISGPYSGRPAFHSFLYVRRDQTDIPNNRSSYAWAYYARNPSYGGSFALDCFAFGVNVGGQGFSGCHALDFRGPIYEIVLGAGSTGWFNHDSNGYLSIVIDAWHGPASIFGTSDPGALWFATDRIPQRPATPGAPSVSAITTNSMTLSWSIPDNRGAAIDQMLLRYSTNPDVEAGPYTDLPNAGNATSRNVTGLTPGQTYYFVVYAHNSVGYSNRSGVTSAQTIPATPPPFTVAPSLSGSKAVVTLSPPSGSTGVTSYEVQYRPRGGGAATTITGASPITVSALTPGLSYEWRARAMFRSTPSPWSDWATYFQPNPNVNPGNYFDGSTADTADIDFQWTGTVNNSIAAAVGKNVKGWRDFATAAGSGSGGTGAQYRVTGAIGRYPEGQPSGSFACRYAFFRDATAAGFRAGTANTVEGRADISEGGVYFGSIYAQPSRSQRLAAGISLIPSGGGAVQRFVGPAQIVPANTPVRLSLNALAPFDGYATVEAVDVEGDGWSLWKGGETITVDAAMVTVGSQFPYFDGSAPDTSQYQYAWLGVIDASVSTRTTLAAAVLDPLADPDCPAPPSPPAPPVIEDDCITEVGVWRRYWVQISQPEIAQWIATIPTLTLTTGSQAAREVRIRYYENPDATPPEAFTPGEFVSEQIVRYLPPNTTLSLDGVSERARASVDGGDWIAADHLLYGTGGSPATWPLLQCGVGYLVSLDVPLDAALGNLAPDLALTRRML